MTDFMKVFFYQDIEQLQQVLETVALKSNRGVCETYNYCDFCKEPTCIVRKSKTPCADAFLACGANYVYVAKDKDADAVSEGYRRFVLYGINFVKVQLRNRESGEFSGELKSYIADIPLQVGDVVKIPARYGSFEGVVCQVDVPAMKLERRIGELLHITQIVTP